LAVFLLATSAQFFLAAHWVVMDPLLTLFLTAALFAGAEILRAPRPAWLALFYGALALAIWTKGLVALAIPFAGLLPFFILCRASRPWRNFRPVIGGAVLGGFVALVLAAFYLAEGAEALRQLVWVNQVLRFVSPSKTGHAQPFYHYLQSLPLMVLPWAAPFLALFRPAFWKGRLATGAADPRIYLACMTAGPLALLSVASTKRGIYLLPLLPPLFILAAAALQEVLARDPADRPRWIGVLFGAVQPVVLAAWGLALPASVLVYTRSPWTSTIVLLVFGALAGLAGLWSGPRGGLSWAWEAHRFSAVLFCVCALTLVVPLLDAQKDMAPFAARVDAFLPAGEDVHALAADETLCGIIPFVTGRRVSPISGVEMESLLKEGKGPAYLLQRVDPGTYSGDLAKTGYRLLLEGRFGTGRILRLWKAEPAAAAEIPAG
jgi:4-amino-4-deoxy-L-arabinose transferase-like glycosyltransferase